MHEAPGCMQFGTYASHANDASHATLQHANIQQAGQRKAYVAAFLMESDITCEGLHLTQLPCAFKVTAYCTPHNTYVYHGGSDSHDDIPSHVSEEGKFPLKADNTGAN